jgi:hypothetical protein
MSMESQQLRDQARRAQRLSESVSDHRACQALRELAKAFKADADRLEQAGR